MAKPNRKSIAKRVKFEEAKFFKYLKDNADASLLNFLHSIDKRAWVEMSTYVNCYLRRSDEEGAFAARRQRGVEMRKALSKTIRAVQKASAAYKELEAIEVGGGRLGQPGSKLRPTGSPSLADVLKAEEENLEAFLEHQKKLYNEKRFGVSGNHMWLVMLQEFFSEWTRRELGEVRELRSEDIAKMIEAAKLTLGWREDKTETDSELVRKAIRNFRANQANTILLSGQIVPYVQNRCSAVADGPYLLGIEI
jgi:hypothetical protein